MIACNPIKDVIPIATKLPNISGALIAIKIPLQMKTANRAITMTQPTNPNSSANTAKIKSVCGSDMYKNFCLLSPESYSKQPT